MPLVTEMQHPRSMDFRNQRRVVVLRTIQKLTWGEIVAKVHTLQGPDHHPSESQCRDVCKAFSIRKGRRAYKYKKCGRKPWKITKDVETFLIRKLRELRVKCVCTSTTLQRELLRKKNVQVECSIIRKVLKRNGYRWLRRIQKPQYNKNDRDARMAFADEVLEMSRAELAKYLTMCMDGVVLSLAPTEPVARANFCKVGETHMWRKKDEAAKPELSGGDKYDKQFSHERAVPMWGGIGPGGFGLVMFHEFRKVSQDEWSKAVNDGKLTEACRAARPDRQQGPWRILCDNESFLNARLSRAAHLRKRIELWHIPARSPDLNPVELYWSWVRKKLRLMDLADLRAGRPPIRKAGLKVRVRALLQTPAAKTVAMNTFGTLRQKCLDVKRHKGRAILG